jgi:hypothetical protein
MLCKKRALPVVLYGFETYILGVVLREEYEERRRHTLYYSRNIIIVIVSRRTRLVEIYHVTRVTFRYKAYSSKS